MQDSYIIPDEFRDTMKDIIISQPNSVKMFEKIFKMTIYDIINQLDFLDNAPNWYYNIGKTDLIRQFLAVDNLTIEQLCAVADRYPRAIITEYDNHCGELSERMKIIFRHYRPRRREITLVILETSMKNTLKADILEVLIGNK